MQYSDDTLGLPSILIHYYLASNIHWKLVFIDTELLITFLFDIAKCGQYIEYLKYMFTM